MYAIRSYYVSGTYYFIGWVFFVMMLCPMLYIFFGVPTYFARPEVYLLFFAPYVVLTLSLFFYTLGSRITSYNVCYTKLLRPPIRKGRWKLTASPSCSRSRLSSQLGMAMRQPDSEIS